MINSIKVTALVLACGSLLAACGEVETAVSEVAPGQMSINRASDGSINGTAGTGVSAEAIAMYACQGDGAPQDLTLSPNATVPTATDFTGKCV